MTDVGIKSDRCFVTSVTDRRSFGVWSITLDDRSWQENGEGVGGAGWAVYDWKHRGRSKRKKSKIVCTAVPSLSLKASRGAGPRFYSSSNTRRTGRLRP